MTGKAATFNDRRKQRWQDTEFWKQSMVWQEEEWHVVQLQAL
jgi:hypothetical protein